ncbi:hypothetical protein A3F00_03210 [Candidatus Daviesbacteria bacterium RIFCSPHIGHO2_12_FULL_37_11]|uniref:Uncharacterized protein n=1 Tax=Candidatus Daviesbacteria bacterium RIFCSPHIGHO2_12_FULL_37_11 TaxID=1797777 RepID=A0A1F5KA71_9BACT|nr:MAG: hypothetical protein A2111_02120 [Candidatus Daviesbacteria bacterium GWA1_38_6]OGE18293.1 MAG: hypothetical protein A2769_03940 [Candidatus Daviesbacteria bacterium RIFCSPHIGHO2_01_FULL_37_27]OGE37826.1 MAG: hypothetical protein A3F00_03210 [Candidatus Daviesbacteria bacterium RIFCSPHIGHO2_12_FULL_37_11]OGE45456.1 MAG: hypothetical protein A3B39_04410 [Candidatus Daviesbacteria bacterium RIFCSPLOWO2_01_FULL_37_10]
METEAEIIARNPEMEKFLVTPGRARAHLEFLGYTEDMWDRIMREKFGSHNVRAYISIVRGGGSKTRRISLSGGKAKRWPISHKKFTRC